jgi:hypothetical protein
VIAVLLTLAGIALPSALAVAAVRRWIAPVPARIAMLFFLATLAFLHGAVFTSKMPVPIDEASRGNPYRGVVGDVVPKNPLLNDTTRLFLPWMQVAREELFHFRAPLWNRYAFSGYPLLGNAEAAPFSPLFLATLFVPLPKQLVAMAGLKILLSLLFTYLVVKREGASDGAAVFAAVAYGFSSFETVVLYYSVSAVSALLPMVVFAVLHAIDVPSRRAAVFVAISVATICANGHPESVVHVAIAIALILAIELAFAGDRREWLRRFVTPLLGAIAGVLIAMPVWLPAAQQVLLSTRYAVLRSGAPKMTIPLTAAWAILNPNGFGNPARGNWNWILNYMIVAESYLGLLVLVLFGTAVVSPRTSGRTRLWATAAIVTFIAAMDWTAAGHALNAIPPFDIAANDKLRFVSLFFAVVVAAKWLDGVDGRRAALAGRELAPGGLPSTGKWQPMTSERPLPLVVVGGAIATASLYVYWKQIALMRPTDLAGVAAVAAFVILYRWGRPRAPWLAGAAAVLTLVELFTFNANFNRLVEAKYYRPELPIVQALRAHAPKEPFRIAGFNWVLMPNGATQYGLEDIRGSDPMSLASYTRVLEGTGEIDAEVIRVLRPDHPLLDFLGVRYLLAEPEAAFGGKWRLVYRGADGALFENSQAKPRFFAPEAAVEVAQRSTADFALRIQARRAVTVLSSEPAAAGWEVRVRERRVPVRVVEGAFVGFDVPAGECRVTVRYRPRAFYGALLGTVAGLGLLMLIRRAPRRSGGDLLAAGGTGEDHRERERMLERRFLRCK